MTVGGLTQMNRAPSPMQQFLAHPNWQEETEEPLEKGSYVIMKKDDSNFCILWLNKQGEKTSAHFKIIDKEFWFKNGQAHYSYRLDELISEVFQHYQ